MLAKFKKLKIIYTYCFSIRNIMYALFYIQNNLAWETIASVNKICISKLSSKTYSLLKYMQQRLDLHVFVH